jgi:hypothetical protein
MEPHSEDGTHKLELPVSRTTLKVCGGVPIVISEKSVKEKMSAFWPPWHHESICREMRRTLGVQKVIDQHVMAAVWLDGGILERVLIIRRSDTQILLAQGAHMLINAAFLLHI